MRCEYPGCEKQKTCFHYCHEHHTEVCLKQRSRLTPVVGDEAASPDSGEQTRTSGQAGEGSAPHPPRA